MTSLTDEETMNEYHGCLEEDKSASKKGRKRLCTRQSCTAHLLNNLMLYLTILGVIFGFVIGFLIRLTNPSPDAISWMGLVGDVYLRLLKLMIIPLMFCSMIVGTATMDKKTSGRAGMIGFGYIVGTNALGTVIGLTLGLTIKPGISMVGSRETSTETITHLTTSDIMADLIRNLFPENIVRAAIKQEITRYEIVTNEDNLTSMWTNASFLEKEKYIDYTETPNLLGIVFFSIVMGIATGVAGENGKPFLTFIASASEIIFIVIGWFMWLTPIGVASLIMASVAEISNLEAEFVRLGVFVTAVCLGMILLYLVIYPLLYLVVTRRNFFLLWGSTLKGWIVGTVTTSAAVAIPDILQGLDKYKVDRRISRLLVPIATTISTDGSNIFLTCSAIFLAQTENISLNVGQIITIGILVILSTLALPPIPSASLVALVVILSASPVPAKNVAILFTVEWFLDRVRTSANVMSLIVGTAITDHICKTRLETEEATEI